MKTLAAAALLLALVARPARASPGVDLLEAARRGDVGGARAALERGADPNGASPSGWTPLLEAVRAGHAGVVLALLDAGARPDARDRWAGTALDVAQRAGRPELVALLRARGARGSGRSVGDRLCVLRWGGEGYCGRVEAAEGRRLGVRVESVEGCRNGCAPDPECSEGRPLGGGFPPPETLRIPAWCVTRTFPGSGAVGP